MDEADEDGLCDGSAAQGSGLKGGEGMTEYEREFHDPERQEEARKALEARDMDKLEFVFEDAGRDFEGLINDLISEAL